MFPHDVGVSPGSATEACTERLHSITMPKIELLEFHLKVSAEPAVGRRHVRLRLRHLEFSLCQLSVYHQGKNICEGGDEMDITSAEGAGTEIDPSTGQVKHGGCGR